MYKLVTPEFIYLAQTSPLNSSWISNYLFKIFSFTSNKHLQFNTCKTELSILPLPQSFTI